MQALTDRTLLFIILAIAVITMVFVVFTKDDGDNKKFTVPFLPKKTDDGKENDIKK